MTAIMHGENPKLFQTTFAQKIQTRIFVLKIMPFNRKYGKILYSRAGHR
jgi:hypothetical protein